MLVLFFFLWTSVFPKKRIHNLLIIIFILYRLKSHQSSIYLLQLYNWIFYPKIFFFYFWDALFWGFRFWCKKINWFAHGYFIYVTNMWINKANFYAFLNKKTVKKLPSYFRQSFIWLYLIKYWFGTRALIPEFLLHNP